MAIHFHFNENVTFQQKCGVGQKKNLKSLNCRPFENSKLIFFLNRLLHSSKDQSRTIYKLEM